MARCGKQQWHGILGWRELLLMWREESLFYIDQDIGDYIGDILRGFSLVQEAESREIQAANTKKGSNVVGYNAIRVIPPNCYQLHCVQLGGEKHWGQYPMPGGRALAVLDKA